MGLNTIIVGLGNPMMKDDGLGVVVAEAVARAAAVDVVSGPLTGLRLLDFVEGYERLIVVDAACTGGDEPGTIRRHSLAAASSTEPPAGPHSMDLPQVLACGARAGYRLPEVMVIYTMEAASLTLGEELSPPVAAALPAMIERILTEQLGAGAPSGPAAAPLSAELGTQRCGQLMDIAT